MDDENSQCPDRGEFVTLVHSDADGVIGGGASGHRIHNFWPHSCGVGNVLERLLTDLAPLPVFVGFSAIEALVDLALTWVDVTARSWAGGRSGSPGAGLYDEGIPCSRHVRAVMFLRDHTVELVVAKAYRQRHDADTTRRRRTSAPLGTPRQQCGP